MEKGFDSTTPLSAWDPLTEQLLKQIRATDEKNAIRLLLREKKPTIRLLIRRLWFLSRGNAVEALFAFGAVGLACAGAIVLWLSFPWTMRDSPYADVVAAVGGATVFGSLIVSAVAAPQAIAAAMAPGYTAEVLTRRAPWVLGFGLVLLGGFLFTLAAMGPDQEATLASGFLTAASFSSVWWVSRLLISSADSLTISQRQAKYIQHSFWLARSYSRSIAKAWIKRSERTDQNLDVIRRTEDLKLLSGFLRHMRAGVYSGLGTGSSSIAVPFIGNMIDLYANYAERVNGEIGGFDGPIQIVLSGVKEVVWVMRKPF